MPNIFRIFDDPPGPLLDLYVSVNTTERMEMIEQGVLVPKPVFIGKALIDTGATQSHVAIDVLERLGLDPVTGEKARVRSVTTGDDTEEMDVYSINVEIRPDQGGVNDTIAEELRVVGSPKLSGLNVGMLLGRDILSQCLLVFDGSSKRFTLAYDRVAVTES